ncbi:PKD domain-containing protein [Friedmanniella luteola]|uniref:PKD domain-containing protein n=1 Tax=Friedmanniella luteola TaxID=546871 RepID=A0A1H1LNF5_9ACTN|nr:PKD domain-containing protein [Friedmanniella luteola]SDR76071.1 PKD domain-containing protein [Friedmanniella luteola]
MGILQGRWSRVSRLTAGGLATAVVALGLGAAPAATADTRPVAATLPTTVSVDPLPTWQLTGVVWSQVVVGTTVYATGDFTKARPPGMWAGGPTEISVGHLFAYDITTGERVASFNHTLNAAGLAITASPDGKRVYVGGDFTTVDGQSRQHLAAFDTATGALAPGFAPIANGQVKALTATASTLYVGGAFESAGSGTVVAPRKRLAAFSTSTSALLSWAPKADDGYVWSLTTTPDATKVVIGGQFSTLNSAAVYGLGAVGATSGTNLPWAASGTLRDSGKGAINSLTNDGTWVYGSGFAFGAGGLFEGSFSLNPANGAIRWMVDCLGDTYDVEPVGDVTYTVSHTHDCRSIGGFGDTSPRTRWQPAGAFTTAPTGLNNGPNAYGWNYKGRPAPTMLHWYPELGIGTASQQYQAAWNVVSGGRYIALGGEFPTVNGKAQQGLTRYALPDTAPGVAPNKVGPQYLGTVPVRSAPPATTASVPAAGTVRVTYGAAWDKDNQRLTYQLYRDRGTAAEALVDTRTVDSNFWTLPAQTVDDRTAPAGSHTYQVRVTDPFGNELLSPVSNSVSASGNAAPTASFTSTATGLTVSVDGGGSTDADGTVASYAWTFGDGSTATGRTASRTYAAAGTYSVRLTVTDNQGATGTTTRSVTVASAPPANAAPTAAFTSTATGLTVSVDGGGSTDSDGTVASYAWTFGDGSTATGRTASRTYAAAGTYSVKLTVTDDQGATGTVTKQLTVAAPPANDVLAADTFERTSASGWGSAETGGAWTYSGSTTLFTVGAGQGVIKMAAAGSGPTARLPISSTDTDLQLTFAFDKAPTGGGQYTRAIVRGDQTNGYHAKIWVQASGTMVVYLNRNEAGTETSLASKVLPGTFVAGQDYAVRIQAWGSGTTNLRTKVWAAGTTEPTAWAATATDTTASLQAPAGVAVRAYLSGTSTAPVSLSVSELTARRTGN